MSNDLGYFSHIPVLAALTARTLAKRSVLELGMGWGSTPLLHALCRLDGRGLYSYETDPAWMDTFRFLEGDFHRFRPVKSWEGETFSQEWDQPGVESRYSVAFIDCAPGEIRRELALRLKDRCEYIILHDALCDGVHGGGGDYRYESILPQFKYHAYYGVLRPATLALSNFRDVGISEVEQKLRTIL